MDSGNSGASMQSSSGGDEEYDSRPHQHQSAAPTNFLNPSINFASLLSHQQPTFFDPCSNFHLQSHDSISSNPSNYLDLIRSRTGSGRSEPNNGPNNQSLLAPPHQGTSFSSSSMQSQSRAPPSDQNQNQSNVVVGKNPKKRTRASRRAPTTVLTTDTSNFRAMVQEFTGIPAPPFSGSSSYSRGRFDLFGSGSTIKSTHLDSMASLYNNNPLRPTTHQKFNPLNPNPFASSSSTNIADAIAAANATTAANTNSNSNNYQMLSQNMLNIQQQQQQQQQQNQLLSFLQPPLNMPAGFSTAPVSKSQANFGLPSFDDHQLGMSHGGHATNNASSLGGLPNHHQHHSSQDQNQLRSNFDGNNISYGGNSSQRITTTNCSSSDFHQQHGNKSLEHNVSSSRGGGTVDSWICPSNN